MSVGREAASYVLPFRADGEGDVCELAEYLAKISALAEVIVIDGSSPRAFEVTPSSLAVLFSTYSRIGISAMQWGR